jgi:hypothetical protein
MISARVAVRAIEGTLPGRSQRIDPSPNAWLS